MSLLGIFKKARQKPRHVRDNIAFAAAAVFTAVIAVVWVYHAPGSFSATGEAGTATDQDEPFFAQIRSSIAEQTANVKDAFSSVDSKQQLDDSAQANVTVASSTVPTTFTLSEENRRAIASSTATTSDSSATQTEMRRVVRIATTTSSSSDSVE